MNNTGLRPEKDATNEHHRELPGRAEDGSAVYYLSQPRDRRTLTLHRMDPATGEVTTVLSEAGATRVEPNQWGYQPPIVRVLAGEVLWYSQRDGWGHLYRYDLNTGELLGQLTSGQWAVRQIRHVDETERAGWPTGSLPPTRTSSCSSCPGPSTSSSTAWPTSAPAPGTSWSANCWATRPPAYRPAPIPIHPELLGELFA
ncbi:DPP IV N-terminal domain-containing protein [Kribbella sp. NPDC049174]|uniref:DPP IV N-terminal domain-containing protein n=1 Tax=Kribbella sp. NPDC049174 TaxID=3364112 RepID=UPI003724605C